MLYGLEFRQVRSSSRIDDGVPTLSYCFNLNSSLMACFSPLKPLVPAVSKEPAER